MKSRKIIVIVAALLTLVAFALVLFSFRALQDSRREFTTIEVHYDSQEFESELRALVRAEYAAYQSELNTMLVIFAAAIAMFGIVVPMVMQKERTKELDDAIQNHKNLQEKLNIAETQLETTEGKIDALLSEHNDLMQQTKNALDKLAKQVGEIDKEVKGMKDPDTEEMKALKEKERITTQKLKELVSDRHRAAGIPKSPEKGNRIGFSAIIQGNIEFKNENYDGALQYYQSALGAYRVKDESQNLALAYYNASIASWFLRKYSDSLKYVNSAMKLNKNNADYFNLKGLVLQEKGRYLAALNSFNKAVLMEPEKEAFINNRTIILDMMSDPLANCNEAIKLNPNHAENYDTRAINYRKFANFTTDPEEKAEYERLAKEDEETAKKLRESENKGEQP
ncbi:MAG: hypothetical protein FWD06_09365 [Oscillospiraceae bacterium]|nr:hypothetical protein [Oscillospiraceae bacterium]